MDQLVAHVRGLDRAALASLLAARPDAAAWPEPRSLSELAERLSAVHSVQRALARVSRAGLQVAEAMAALGGLASEAGLAQLLDVDATRSALFDDTLDALRELALLVRDSDGDSDGGLALAAPLRLLGEPLGLGVRLTDALPLLVSERLRAVAEGLVANPAKRKSQLFDQVRDALADPEAVRAWVGSASPDVQRLLHSLAWDGPRLRGNTERAHRGAPVDEAFDRGMLARISWDDVELPGEIGLALRGPDYRAPFSAEPPSPVCGEVVEADLIAAGTAAVTQILADAGRLLDLCDRTPLATTKTGRLAVREFRRAAKSLGLTGDALDRLLAVAMAAGLLGTVDGEITLTRTADAWRDAEPAARLATLLAGWWPGAGSVADAVLRRHVLTYLVELPVGGRVDDVEALAAVLAWRSPIALASTPADQETVAARTAAVLADAERLGVVALGAATPLARALVEGLADDPDALASASEGLVPVPVTTVTFQSDLSAVVSGVPAAGLATLLDGTAEREASGAASTWRFSPAGVRAALDAGIDADALLDGLAAVATAGLPQALVYLVRDVARRHGHLRVAPAASVVCADDPALLAELVATKALSGLRLRTVAPGVLISASDPDTTLAVLRDAGYAPTGLTEGGGTRVERRTRRRAAAPAVAPSGGASTVDAEGVADRLLAAPAIALPLPRQADSDSERIVARRAQALSTGERAALVDAIETGGPVRIDYISATGAPTSRIIEQAELTGDAVTALCHLRNAERMFLLSRIRAVSPA
ncbi:helicase-associated domain-containing protein [Cryptosporangium sp. NPDC051539]|uniref:helicase-associated domain-containing protein n=1 Tax=Cryptosporangium sp. NPDC051539 TaxID=3363962 RepID=UPI0037AE64E5